MTGNTKQREREMAESILLVDNAAAVRHGFER